MDEQARQPTALDDEEGARLAKLALETEYVARLEAYLADEHDETVATDEPRAFELDDGVRAVTVSDGTDDGPRPDVAITVHVDDGDVVQATAERHDVPDATVELAFPTELAPGPEAAVTDILRPTGQSVAVTVDEGADVTTYTIET
ncbi:hypothetical protein [Haloterrigena alkaliphila]|uniref:Uncharacterized protein n=1 Tax=Haloterrigena alkaliphila TaxID=2816475 RepID=A0A8A2VKH7_9EURY|nr:hypothetical protein [Haloterrigena alkaliphila]QSX00823.1 hypothetical protein J0X25_07655 [Haloterrigena alkaliphila]